MRRSSRSRVGVLAVLLLLLSVLVGCGGGSDATQQQLEQARREGAAQQKIKDQQAQLKRDIRELKKQARGNTSSSSPSSGESSGGGSSSGGSAPTSAASCGQGVSAGSATSCAFALNVARAYFEAGGGSPTLSVYSPVTNQTYTMRCSAGAPTVCRGGNNAVVYIR